MIDSFTTIFPSCASGLYKIEGAYSTRNPFLDIDVNHVSYGSIVIVIDYCIFTVVFGRQNAGTKVLKLFGKKRYQY